MVKSLIISSLLLISLNGIAQSVSDSIFYRNYMDSGYTLFQKLKKQASDTTIKFDKVINYYNTAMLIYPEKADSARKKILDVFRYIDTVKRKAITDRIRADEATRAAEIAKSEAEYERRESYKNTLANAPYKYIRLIRDGPKDWDNISKDTFDLKLIAYCNHLDTLKKYLDTVPEQKTIYAGLREQLYYDNDLYEKIYKCFESHSKEAIKENLLYKSGDKYNDFSTQFFADKSAGFKLADDGSGITKDAGKEYESPPNAGQKFTTFALSNKSKLIFCATDDNYIVSYNSESFGMHRPVNSIAMGTKVTALDFDDKNNIILFGTVSGDIGFIKWNADNKNQPVYDIENAMDSKITAINLFEYNQDTFLLVTGKTSNPVVYKIDGNLLKPGNKFFGNILPKQDPDPGDINHAVFNTSEGKVILETAKAGTFLWDPFTESVLKKYKIFMQYEAPDQIYNEDELKCFIWVNTKFY